MPTIGPDRCLHCIVGMSMDAGHALLEAIAEGTSIELDLCVLEPARALAVLAEGGQSHRVTVENDTTRVTVEVGNGLVVGAKAQSPAGNVSGQEAYELLRELTAGTVKVEPLRFPSLANILVPITDLPDVHTGLHRLPKGEPTVQVALPDQRTVEIDLPSDIVELPAVPKASLPPAPPAAALPAMPAAAPSAPPVATASEPEPAPELQAEPAPSEPPPVLDLAPTVEVPARRAPSLRIASAAGALVALLGLGVGGLVWASQSEAEPAPGLVSVPSTVELTPTEPVEEPVDAEPEDDGTAHREQARTLARQARAELREGNSGQALDHAREAAELRGGLPYYQTLLGDALHANGRRAAARRAYRRALRLRPGYAPAQRRIDRMRRQRQRRRAARAT